MTPPPGHTLSLRPPLVVCNLLPFDFNFCYLSREKLVPHGKEVAIHIVNPLRPIKFSISKLEGYDGSRGHSVGVEDVGVIKSHVVWDNNGRHLTLNVATEMIGKGSLKVRVGVCTQTFYLYLSLSLSLFLTYQLTCTYR